MEMLRRKDVSHALRRSLQTVTEGHVRPAQAVVDRLTQELRAGAFALGSPAARDLSAFTDILVAGILLSNASAPRDRQAASRLLARASAEVASA
jgi:hypothetical protein